MLKEEKETVNKREIENFIFLHEKWQLSFL